MNTKPHMRIKKISDESIHFVYGSQVDKWTFLVNLSDCGLIAREVGSSYQGSNHICDAYFLTGLKQLSFLKMLKGGGNLES